VGAIVHIILERPIEGTRIIKAFDLAVKIAGLKFHWKVMAFSETPKWKEKGGRYGAIAYLAERKNDAFNRAFVRIVLVPVLCRPKEKIRDVEIVIVDGNEKVFDPLWGAEFYPKKGSPCWKYADDFTTLAMEFEKSAKLAAK